MSTGKIVGLINALGGSPSGGGGTPNAVQFVEQTLTEEQQMQARKNLSLAYSAVGIATILDTTSIEIDGDGGVAPVPSALDLTEGMKYQVTWDGALYECECYFMELFETLCIGNGSLMYGQPGGNGEPFIFVRGFDTWRVIAQKAGVHSVSIVGEKEIHYPFGSEYIPTPFGKLLTGEETEPIIVWNGDTAGLEMFEYNASRYYKVGDPIPFSDWGKYRIAFSDGDNIGGEVGKNPFYKNENDTVRESRGTIIAHEAGTFQLYDSSTGNAFETTVTIESPGTYFAVMYSRYTSGVYKATERQCLTGIEINGGAYNGHKFVITIDENGALSAKPM